MATLKLIILQLLEKQGWFSIKGTITLSEEKMRETVGMTIKIGDKMPANLKETGDIFKIYLL